LQTAAYLAHPERFVRKPPELPKLPASSWINPHEQKDTAAEPPSPAQDLQPPALTDAQTVYDQAITRFLV
jgi:hypothetical protein